MAMYWFQKMSDVRGNTERRSSVKYPFLACLILNTFKRGRRVYSGNRMSKRGYELRHAMIIPFLDGQVSRRCDHIPCGCYSRYRAGRFIPGGLVSIAELRCVTLSRVVVSLAIGAMVTLGSFGFTRSGRIGFPAVLLLLVEQVHLIRAKVQRFGIRGEVGETRKF